jgi:hypothetical protein
LRKLLTGMTLLIAGSAAHAQTSNTNCTTYIPNNMQCTTTTMSPPQILDTVTPIQRQLQLMQQQQQFQQQQQLQQQQLQLEAQQQRQQQEAVMAARLEREREEQATEEAAEEARIHQEAVETAIKNTLDSDNAPLSPPPTDEKPVILVCNINNSPSSVVLYEKHNRVDATSGGRSHTRQATFTAEAVTWESPLIRSSLSRVDGSYIGYGNIPVIEGQRFTGSCKIATARAF